MRCRAACGMSSTARSNAASFTCEGLLKPESLRMNCIAVARTSSSVVGGSKLKSGRMLRHMVRTWRLRDRCLVPASGSCSRPHVRSASASRSKQCFQPRSRSRRKCSSVHSSCVRTTSVCASRSLNANANERFRLLGALDAPGIHREFRRTYESKFATHDGRFSRLRASSAVRTKPNGLGRYPERVDSRSAVR